MTILINALKNRERDIDPDRETIAPYGCHHCISHTGEIDESADVLEAVQKRFFLYTSIISFWRNYEMMEDSRQFQVGNGKNKPYAVII